MGAAGRAKGVKDRLPKGGEKGEGGEVSACGQYLDVVNGFGRRNGSKLSVVKLLCGQGLEGQ